MGFLFGGSGNTSTSANQQTTSSTSYPDWYTDYTKNVLGKAAEAGETPYKPYDISKMFADFTPDQRKAFADVSSYQQGYQPYFDASKGILNQLQTGQYNPLDAARPYLNAAGQSQQPWNAGAGFINQSAGAWNAPGVQQSYMDPYTEGAINRANEISTRNFTEKTMPGINAQFAKGQGAIGRSNYNKFTGRAVRDLANEQSGNADTMMNQAYWNAANQFNTDQGRMQQAGVNLGNLANQNMGALSNLAQTNAGITSGAVNTGIGLSNAYSQQAGALSNMNLQNANAQLNIGNIQQQQAQRPLTAAYQQDQQAKQWPFEMVNFMNAAQRGLQIPTTQQSNTTSTQSQTSGSSPSILGQVLGGASLLGSIPGVSDAVGGLFGSSGSGLPGTDTAAQNAVNQYGTVTIDPNTGFNSTPGLAARGGYVRRLAQGGTAFGPVVEPRGVLSRRYARGGSVRGPLNRHRYAVGGDVPVMRGMNSRNGGLPMPPPMMPPMPPPGGLSAMPPAMPPPIGALGGLETGP